MKKKLYIVATDVPSIKGGASVRNLNLIEQYLKHNYEVSVFCVVEAGAEDLLDGLKSVPSLNVHTVKLPALTASVMARAILVDRITPYMEQYRMSPLSEALKKACETDMPDIIQFEEITAYDAVEPVLRSLRPAATLVLDAHNVEQAALEHAFRSFSLVRKLAGLFVLPNIRKIENTAAAKLDVVLACSEEDATYFRQLAKKVVVVPNGADCGRFSRGPKAQPETLLFMGGTSYLPNDEALHWYFSKIHPIVKQAKPNVQICILGGRPPAWLKKLASGDSTIQLPGHVDDVRDYLNQASICISPMVGGFGTSLKILEYMASSKAVVSTTVGARGISYTADHDLLIADDAKTFASTILALMETPAKREALGRNARKLTEDVYDWDVIGAELAKAL